jgi:hypothetical protein
MNLCIPRIKSNITKEYLKNKLCKLQLFGKIERIIEIPLKNDNEHKRILIKIIWNNNNKSRKFQETIKNMGSIKYVYDFPWYWKILITNHKI